ncbi:MAG: glycoside hydrolase family 3 N-terminal domain-containing protein [Elusimicrobiota bacterium]|jgi:beta-glucosidase
MKKTLSLALILAVLAPSARAAVPAAPGPRDVEARVEALLSRMTLEEKLGQLQQLDGLSEGTARPEFADLARKGRLGSTLNVRGAANVNALQRIAVEESRLKVPILFAFDVIHGYRTVFPVPLAEAASWDPAAAERAAAVAAAEAAAVGLKWTFAPMVDIARDPRWGRIVEGSGEDAYLGAALARARVRGFQGADPAAPDKVAACAKHWAAYGAAESGRDYNTTDVSERVLRETYFPPFRAAVEAGVATFMSAFNDLDGIPATANRWILTDVLRGEWGFDGLVVTDYTAVAELIPHGLAADGADAARLALSAGADMEMVSRLYNEHGPKLVADGRLPLKTVDEAVRRVLRLKFRLGLFEHPYVDPKREKTALLTKENLAAARAAAAKSFVLLKNDGGVLPLDKGIKTLAVLGPLADDPSVIGSWSGDGKKEDALTLLAGLRAKFPKMTILHAKGCAIDDASSAGFQEAVAAAGKADAVVLALGESSEMSGEASSRSTLDLPGRQLELAEAVLAAGKPVAVVLMNGRPLTLTRLAAKAPAILETWFAGSQAGPAIADALFGDVNPGGKLPVTFPRALGQVPLYYNHKGTGRPPALDNKYTSKYLDVPVTPLYPFGYGLSYTSFRLSGLELSAGSIQPDGTLEVRASVENAGARAGDEVVQLYIRDAAASATRPVRELKGFERVTLKPGEKRAVVFTLGPKELGALDARMRFTVEPGKFQVFVGTDSTGGLEGSFDVAAK